MMTFPCLISPNKEFNNPKHFNPKTPHVYYATANFLAASRCLIFDKPEKSAKYLKMKGGAKKCTFDEN